MATIDDRDAPWINTVVKTALVRNKRVYKNWGKRGRPNGCLEYVKTVQKETKILINGAKNAYIDILSKKLCDPKTGQKEFWGAHKRIVNKKKNTNIPPCLENRHFVTDFSDKQKYSIITLPSNVDPSTYIQICQLSLRNVTIA